MGRGTVGGVGGETGDPHAPVADLVSGHFPGTRVTQTPMPPGDPLQKIIPPASQRDSARVGVRLPQGGLPGTDPRTGRRHGSPRRLPRSRPPRRLCH
jgi:hypothetical protein